MSNCALNANGELKEPSEIQWFNDIDNDIPLPSTQATSSSSTSGASTVLPRGTLDLFVGQKGSQVAPATMIAGSHRSGRALKPSAKVRDATDTTSAFKLTQQEWSNMELIRDVLKVRSTIDNSTEYLCLLATYAMNRNLPMLSRRSLPLWSLLYGVQFPSLNIFKRHGKIWLAHQHLTVFLRALCLAWIIFASGIERQTTQMFTSFALLCAS